MDTSPDDPQDHLVMATLWYQRSAEFRALCYQSFNWARTVVNQALLQPSEKEPAVVLDIDETILDNSPFQAELVLREQPYSPEGWIFWTQQESAGALPGALSFCQYLHQNHVEIFYISNRTSGEMKSTINNLNKLGFPYADKDHLLLKAGTSSKKERREKVTESHEIILFLGDNLNDFSAIFEDRSDHDGKRLVDRYAADFGIHFIVLPNPMYGAWASALEQQEQQDSSLDNATRMKKLLVGLDHSE